MIQSARNLNAAVPISDAATIRDRVSAKNRSDLFSFTVSSASQLNLQFRSSGRGAALQLIQDRNQNGLVDAGEAIATAKMRPKRGAIESNLAAGAYFLQVSTTGRGTNNYRLRMTTTAAAPTESPNPPLSPSPSMAEQVLSFVNDFRSRNGLATVRLNNQLNTAAQGHSQSMATQDFFSHQGKDGSTFDQRIRAAGYLFSTAAENIAAGHLTASAVVDGWINSPGHRANMLNPNVQEIGVGHVFLSNDPGVEQWQHYWTLKLASPQ